MKTKLTFLFIVLSLTVYSQVEFAPIGAEWYYNYREGIQGPETGYYLLKSVKDTIIDSKECKLLSHMLVNSKRDVLDKGQSILYEDVTENKIYRYLFNSFYLLYDFTKVAGDTIIIKEPYAETQYDSILIVVDSVGVEIISDSIQLKTWNVKVIQDFKYYFGGKIVERIGNLSFLFPVNQLDCDGGCPMPIRCYNDDQFNFVLHELNGLQVSCDYVYTSVVDFKSQEISVYPNPFVNSFKIKKECYKDQFVSIEILNLSGQPILHDVS